MAETKDTINSVSVKPIIFSTPMVRALLEGRKTQTRRVMKMPACGSGVYMHPTHGLTNCMGGSVPIAPYSVGDLLWVRETFWIAEYYSYGSTPGGCEISPPPLAYRRGSPLFYAADGNPPNVGNRTYGPEGLRNGAFSAPDPYAIWVKAPSIHMPRWASRITLCITKIRAERLQDISENDARAEGANFHDGDPDEYGMCRRLRVEAKDDFRHIWEDCYHKDSPKAWHRNPWVWVYEFEVIRKNVGEVN